MQLVVSFLTCDHKVGAGRIKTRAAHFWNFPVRTAVHGKSRVPSAIKYDFFKLDDSGNCIIRKTWLHCI